MRIGEDAADRCVALAYGASSFSRRRAVGRRVLRIATYLVRLMMFVLV